MQFLAAYCEGSGVYFSAVDPRHTPKGVEWERIGVVAEDDDGQGLDLWMESVHGLRAGDVAPGGAPRLRASSPRLRVKPSCTFPQTVEEPENSTPAANADRSFSRISGGDLHEV